jgi:hypothetical protein
MPFFENQSRDELRQMYVDAWERRRAGLPLEPLQAQIAAIIELHPEYQPLLDDPAALAREYTPEKDETNPFLHLAMHLAVRDQLATDRPAGIKRAFNAIAKRTGSTHTAEHQLAECLIEVMWEAQRSGLPPDEQEYSARLARLARKS